MARRLRSKRETISWFKPIEVRWGDMDSLGHVNNACYFSYSESARIAFFDEIFRDDASFMNGQGPILASIACDYHEQVHYPATLECGVGLTRIGNSSAELVTPMFRPGESKAVADVYATIVWFDYVAQKTIAVPERLREYLLRSE